MEQQMKIIRVGDPKEKRNGILLSSKDEVKTALTTFYSGLIDKWEQRSIEQVILELVRHGNVSTPYLGATPDSLKGVKAKISVVDKEKDLYLLRVCDVAGENTQLESDLAKKIGLELALLGFLVKVETNITDDGEFVIDFDKLLKPLRKVLPLNKINSVEVATNFMVDHNPFKGKTPSFSLYQQNDIKLSLNFDDAMSMERFEPRCFVRRPARPESDTWRLQGSSIAGPFVPSIVNGLTLPTMCFSVENIRFDIFHSIYTPIVGEKSENSARTLSSMVAAAFLLEK